MMRHYEQKQVGEEMAYFQLLFYMTVCPQWQSGQELKKGCIWRFLSRPSVPNNHSEV